MEQVAFCRYLIFKEPASTVTKNVKDRAVQCRSPCFEVARRAPRTAILEQLFFAKDTSCVQAAGPEHLLVNALECVKKVELT